MANYLKKGLPGAEMEAVDAKVRETVAGIIRAVKDGGDATVRELSQKLDRWSPPSFRLSPSEIDAIVASVPPDTVRDIKFAQEQVRRFAEAQKMALKDIEVETLPGVRLGHRNVPVGNVGCYIPGGRYPMVASAHMSVQTRDEANLK